MKCSNDITEREAIRLRTERESGLKENEIENALRRMVEQYDLREKKVLLLPPDYTRFFSGVGQVTSMCYQILRDKQCVLDIMPALGTHLPMTETEIMEMFGWCVPAEKVLVHDWRNDVVAIGSIPASFVCACTNGQFDEEISIEINKRLADGSYDHIISIGQVLPHEVMGMANYTKNILVGCGGVGMIPITHQIAAVAGVRNVVGVVNSPVRRLFQYAEEHELAKLPLTYILTVSSPWKGMNRFRGIYIGRGKKLFEDAAHHSENVNIMTLPKKQKTVVAWMDPGEYKTVWVANKAIYRTCLALEEGARLVIIAPGVFRFGEDLDNDKLIRKYGYWGKDKLLTLMGEQQELRENSSVVAHLLQGSPERHFEVIYASDNITDAEFEHVGYKHMPLDMAERVYGPFIKEDGIYLTSDGEEYMWLSHPGAGLWRAEMK